MSRRVGKVAADSEKVAELVRVAVGSRKVSVESENPLWVYRKSPTVYSKSRGRAKQSSDWSCQSRGRAGKSCCESGKSRRADPEKSFGNITGYLTIFNLGTTAEAIYPKQSLHLRVWSIFNSLSNEVHAIFSIIGSHITHATIGFPSRLFSILALPLLLCGSCFLNGQGKLASSRDIQKKSDQWTLVLIYKWRVTRR